MGIEIERRFLVFDEQLPMRALDYGARLTQGYLSKEPCVRVRADYTAQTGELTIKGPGLMSRAEFNYPIPIEEAGHLLRMCPKCLDKTRHVLRHGDHDWALDRFHNDLEGLWIAEIELKSEGEDFERPPWLSYEVTNDPRYANVRLLDDGIPTGP